MALPSRFRGRFRGSGTMRGCYNPHYGYRASSSSHNEPKHWPNRLKTDEQVLENRVNITDDFTAGRIKLFENEWRKLTYDLSILDIVI